MNWQVSFENIARFCCHTWFLQTQTEQNKQGLNGTGLVWKILWKWKTPKCCNTCGSSGLSTRGLKVTKYLHKKEKINNKVSPTLSSFWVRARTWLSMLTYMRQRQTTLRCEICVKNINSRVLSTPPCWPPKWLLS